MLLYCFTITIPDNKIIGKVNTSLITKKILNQIFNFIDINQEIIIRYSDYEIETIDLLNGLKKV
jgi:hypothetical protein